MTVLIIGVPEKNALLELRNRAAGDPVDVRELMIGIETPGGDAAHRSRMANRI